MKKKLRTYFAKMHKGLYLKYEGQLNGFKLGVMTY